VHETIYQAIHHGEATDLRRRRPSSLRTGRRMREPRRLAVRRRQRFATPMVVIGERPADATSRTVPGHGEGDLIVGKGHSSAMATLADRASRYVVLVHLAQGQTAPAVRDALIATFAALPTHPRRSLTWDQGVENGRLRLDQVAAELNARPRKTLGRRTPQHTLNQLLDPS
jgi:transposase, IS30 family